MSETRWLVEYVGARPCPVYATDGPWPTCNPWEAKWFDSEAKAVAWMIRPDIVPYSFPWKAESHEFHIGE